MTASLLLSGCAGTVYRTNLEVYCPPMEQYSKDWNKGLATEIESLDEGYFAIPVAIADYAKLRDRIRACEKEKDNI